MMRGLLYKALIALFLLLPFSAEALMTEMVHQRAPSGKGDAFSFELADETKVPSWELLGPKKLRLRVPNLLALPHTSIKYHRTRYVSGMVVEEIPGSPGLHVTFDLKVPLLTFRHQVTPAKRRKPARYTLLIEPTPMPNPQDATRLRGARILPGSEGTLVVLDHTGSGAIKNHYVDHDAHTVRLQWQGAMLGNFWQPPAPAGLVNGLYTYAFSNNLLEMEIAFHPRTGNVTLHKDPKSGTVIVELRTHNMQDDKRKEDIARILSNRRQAVEQGFPLPLNRIVPILLPSEEMVALADKEIGEAYFLDNAQAAEKDHQFGKARGYIDSLLDTFPQTPNRELLLFHKIDIANKMGWKPGWLMEELTGVLARYPNHFRYPKYRLLELKLLNDAQQFERAMAIMNDPNLPHNDPRVVLEQSRANIGMGRESEAKERLRALLQMDGADIKVRANAYYELINLEAARNNLDGASAMLNALPRLEMQALHNDPNRLLNLAGIYYKNNLFDKALDLYVTLIDNYPDTSAVTPWAMLRGAQSYRFMGNSEEAKRLFNRLIFMYPQSSASLWGRIFLVETDTERELEERLKELDTLIAKHPLGDAIYEAFLSKSMLQGDSGNHAESLKTINHLLTMINEGLIKRRANLLRQRYLEAGMEKALVTLRPEYALSLSEIHGDDWRRYPTYVKARAQLSEALMRMGLYRDALPLLSINKDTASKRLYALGDQLASGKVQAVPELPSLRKQTTPREARVRLAEAQRRQARRDWINILALLEHLPTEGFNDTEQTQRLRLLAQAESERGRFPQAVNNLETLLFGRPIGDGRDHYWYANVLRAWKGDAKAMPEFRTVAEKAEDKEVQTLALMRMGDIYQTQRNINDAKAAYQKAAELGRGTPWSELAQESVKQLELVQEMAP
uniref:Tetratricopeptide repeat protein n=1 Tax=Magnetococcus massalia (strain MO-1) TaxID=451514 RepID=A0A1S7LL20_MAGMO|nr:Conserved protein of unknown function. (tetratricopeptide TPR_2 repeat protein) [Candidatus Magnetococcus massalia]